MKFHYDKKADALCIRFNEERYAESDEVKEGVIFDYDKKNNIIGIEILNISKILSKKSATKLRSRKSLYSSFVSRNTSSKLTTPCVAFNKPS